MQQAWTAILQTLAREREREFGGQGSTPNEARIFTQEERPAIIEAIEVLERLPARRVQVSATGLLLGEQPPREEHVDVSTTSTAELHGVLEIPTGTPPVDAEYVEEVGPE